MPRLPRLPRLATGLLASLAGMVLTLTACSPDGGAGHGYELLVDPDGVLLPTGMAVLDLAQAG